MAKMCSAEHCSAQQGDINETCKAEGWTVNHLVLVCNNGKCCNCTCSCLAYNTPVRQSAEESKSIQNFVVGDPVLAYNPDGSATPRSVTFSSGTSPNSVQPEMAYVSFVVDDIKRTVTVTLNHTFLRADDRKLIQAQLLQPGDRLTLANGSAAPVVEIAIKSYTGGVWNIATSNGRPENLNGHLIDTNGILSGDFAVQIYYDELVQRGLAVPLAGTPAVLSRAHDTAVAAQRSGSPTTRSAAPAAPAVQTLSVEEFLGTVVSANVRSRSASRGMGGLLLQGDHSFNLAVPRGAVSGGFLTAAQAQEVTTLLQHDTARDSYRASQAMWLVKIFNAFYPEITIIIDLPNRGGNAYAFYLGNTPYILVQGGLIRAKDLDWQGLALILGCLVTRFNDKLPTCDNGLVCKAQADYYGPAVLQTIFNPLYPDMIFDSIDQLTTLFERLPSKEDEPVAGCHPTTLNCRIETYNRAIAFKGLPECAGGPPPATLKVVGAQATATGTVVITFSEPLDRSSAEKIDNYFFDPCATVEKAVNPIDAPETVVLTGTFDGGTVTTVTVSNVLSAKGNRLAFNQNTAVFTPPAVA